MTNFERFVSRYARLFCPALFALKIFHSAPSVMSGPARLLGICCHCEAQGRPQYSIVMLHTLENSNRFTNISKPDYTIIDQWEVCLGYVGQWEVMRCHSEWLLSGVSTNITFLISDLQSPALPGSRSLDALSSRLASPTYSRLSGLISFCLKFPVCSLCSHIKILWWTKSRSGDKNIRSDTTRHTRKI